MWIPPGVSPTVWFLKYLLMELTYHAASLYVGVKVFMDLAWETASDRHFARDLRASVHGEFRDTVSPKAIERAMYICASNRRSELLFTEGRTLPFMLKPMRRNQRENREMIEEAVRTWRESSAGGAAKS